MRGRWNSSSLLTANSAAGRPLRWHLGMQFDVSEVGYDIGMVTAKFERAGAGPRS
jgi:hypothetical protein